MRNILNTGDKVSSLSKHLFLVFGDPSETLSLAFDILLQIAVAKGLRKFKSS